MAVMNTKEQIKYWIDTSDNDFKAMCHLFQKGDNTWALFIGHIVLEKLLKAWYVKQKESNPPFIHDLVRLSEKGNLHLDDEQKIFWIPYPLSTSEVVMMITKENFIKNAPMHTRKNGFKILRSSGNG